MKAIQFKKVGNHTGNGDEIIQAFGGGIKYSGQRGSKDVSITYEHGKVASELNYGDWIVETDRGIKIMSDDEYNADRDNGSIESCKKRFEERDFSLGGYTGLSAITSTIDQMVAGALNKEQKSVPLLHIINDKGSQTLQEQVAELKNQMSALACQVTALNCEITTMKANYEQPKI